jgi:hypothetical protein
MRGFVGTSHSSGDVAHIAKIGFRYSF